jgi:hypothetical protein
MVIHVAQLLLQFICVAAHFSQAEAQNTTVTLHSSTRPFDLAIHPIQFTLPMSFSPSRTAYLQTSLRSYFEPNLEVANIYLDKYAWEKWSP